MTEMSAPGPRNRCEEISEIGLLRADREIELALIAGVDVGEHAWRIYRGNCTVSAMGKADNRNRQSRAIHLRYTRLAAVGWRQWTSKPFNVLGWWSRGGSNP